MKSPFLLLPFLALQQSAPNTFESATFGFRVKLPAEWVAEVRSESDDELLVHFMPPDDPIRAHFSIQAKPHRGAGDEKGVVSIARLSTDGREDISNLRDIEGQVLGRSVPGLALDVVQSGVAYHTEVLYLIEDRRLFSLQSLAMSEAFDSSSKGFEEIRAGFELLPVSSEPSENDVLADLALRCGSEIAWEENWQAAAERARTEKKLVLVHARFLSSFAISDEDMAGTFMDPDIVALVSERYVPLKLRPGMEVPFSDQEIYGLGPYAFGSDLLIVHPDGRVLRDGAGDALSFLVEGLGADANFPGPKVPAVQERAERARLLLRRGELDAAGKLLHDPRDAAEYLERANLARMLRRGDAALADLDHARREGDAAEHLGDIVLEEAIVLAHLARFGDAEAKLTSFETEHPEHARALEARYWLGAVRGAVQGPAAAGEIWRELALAHPEDRWAWKAAATLTGTAFSLGEAERLAWPSADLASAYREPALEPREPREAEGAARDALHYLIEHQRADGSWIAPSEAQAAHADAVMDFTLATTAICAQAILPHRERDEVEKSIDRALAFVLAAHARVHAAGERAYFMDYGPWSHAYLVSFLADCVEARIGDRELLQTSARGLIDELWEKQKDDGGWSYYVTADLSDSNPSPTPSISFTTAAVLLALQRAGDAGFEVDEARLERGLAVLHSMRNEDGSFEYMAYPEESRRKDAIGSIGRGPVCNHALARAGRAQPDDVRRALSAFVARRGLLDHERGKALMHCGPEGLGSHYVLFDYATAATALATLPEKPSRPLRDAILEGLLAGRSEEGSFRDNPLIGWDCGTGLALQALNALD